MYILHFDRRLIYPSRSRSTPRSHGLINHLIYQSERGFHRIQYASTLEAIQGQILSQSPTDASSGR